MDDYRRMLAVQSMYEDRTREAQAERHSLWLLGRARPAARVWALLVVLGLGLIVVWGL